jgi:NADPH:quinone reductase-like Zn-dependent oxidoreductase
MPSVYLVTIYGLLRLANIQKNQVRITPLVPSLTASNSIYQSVLIHSASGGVGIAAIQLCQYIGAKVRFNPQFNLFNCHLITTFRYTQR